MKTITINSVKHGQHTILVDDDDYELVSKYNWHILKSHGNYYANTHIRINDKIKGLLMHRLLLNINNSMVNVDHINGNGLDNSRNNIRICSISENNRNQGIRKNCKSGYKGVSLSNSRSKNSKKIYASEIRFDGKKYFLGYFETKEQAALAYNKAAIKYHGEFARLNDVGNPARKLRDNEPKSNSWQNQMLRDTKTEDSASPINPFKNT